MPMYEFQCKKCGERFEELFLSSSSSLEDIECPACSAKKPEKLISASAVVGNSQAGGCEQAASGACRPTPTGGFS
ncbi:FmdB family zinc ribbon protein [candidate division KSB1 bacterium]